jgi:quinol-cytochrome oxidoreductase complex cytochrome b subunit
VPISYDHKSSGGFFKHLRPETVPERTLRISLSWGLGGMATVLLLLLFLTGVLLKFVYVPLPAQAYASVLFLENEVPFGQLLRNLHRWSAYGLILISFLHLLRVFYTGAHTAPRHLNWLIGLFLFAAVVLFNFTGYLLPWDQIAYWAITISASMLDYVPYIGGWLKSLVLGGPEPGQATLLNFYTLHTAILPALCLILLPIHFWRVRKAGGLVLPRSAGEDMPPDGPRLAVWPHLYTREAAAALLILAVLLLISMAFNAPLAEQANPGLSPNPTRAPWYFVGLQELLMHSHPVIAVLLIPLLTVAAALALPWVDSSGTKAGVWFRSSGGRQSALLAGVLALVATVAAVVLDEFAKAENAAAAGQWLFHGGLPLIVVLATLALMMTVLKLYFSATRSEVIQAVLTYMLVSYLVLSAIALWFRGQGMQLAWPGT